MHMPAYYHHSQPLAAKQAPVDPLRSSVVHLLSRANAFPCSAAVQSFTQLVPPISRFQLALDVVLPVLDSPVDVCLRDMFNRSRADPPLAPTAFTTHSRFLYPVCTIRAPPNIH